MVRAGIKVSSAAATVPRTPTTGDRSVNMEIAERCTTDSKGASATMKVLGLLLLLVACLRTRYCLLNANLKGKTKMKVRNLFLSFAIILFRTACIMLAIFSVNAFATTTYYLDPNWTGTHSGT